MMDERQFAEALKRTLFQDVEEFGEAVSVKTFKDVGIKNHGVVVKMASGEEFQLTIVRSR